MTIGHEQLEGDTSTDTTVSVDATLVERDICGVPDDFRAIVKHYKVVVFGVVLSKVRNFHQAEDMAQQVFVDAYQRLDTLKEPAKLGYWLRMTCQW